MKKEVLTHTLLLVIATALATIAVRPYLQPPPAKAESIPSRPLYVEPGIQLLRKPDGTLQVYGKVMIDMRTGTIWGFPTGTFDSYPSNPLQVKPITTHPIELGRFALEDTDTTTGREAGTATN